MIVARSLEKVTFNKSSVLTVGTFDGVHLAHQEIVREVVQRAKRVGGRSVVVTFDPHPKEVVASTRGPVELLTTIDERMQLLGRLGVDLLFIINFTYEFSRLGSEEFFKTYLVDGVGVSEVVVGYDHMFGRNREGSTEALVRFGQTYGFSVFALQRFLVDEIPVSSTRIRHALMQGELQKAAELLGYDYMLSGTVVRGDGRGRTIGYPTANIQPSSPRKLVPGRGVYLVAVTIDGVKQHGMMNIGVRPTVTDGRRETLEVHIFDFSGDLYGKPVTITFLQKLRDEQRFASAEELIVQLQQDKQQSLHLLSQRGNGN